MGPKRCGTAQWASGGSFAPARNLGTRVVSVKEIIGIHDITAVPRTPVHVEGVINLRGNVIPVVDPRLTFALTQPHGRRHRSDAGDSESP